MTFAFSGDDYLVIKVVCPKSNRVYLWNKFFVRRGNGVKPLSMRETADYQKEHPRV